MGNSLDLENAVVIDDKSTIIRLPDPSQQQEEQGPVRLNLARIAVANMDSNDNQLATLCYEVDGFGDGQGVEGELIAEVVTGEDVVQELGVTDAGEWVSECYTCSECDFVAMSKSELTVSVPVELLALLCTGNLQACISYPRAPSHAFHQGEYGIWHLTFINLT